MDVLIKLAPVKSSAKLDKLRFLCEKIEGVVRSLQSLEISADMYGTFLSPVLLSKIAEDLRVLLSRKLEKDAWDLNEVITVFKGELILREKCACIPTAMTKTTDRKSGEKSNFKPPYQKYNLGTVSTLYNSKEGQPKIFCCFCKRGHESNHCTAVTDLGARKRIL